MKMKNVAAYISGYLKSLVSNVLCSHKDKKKINLPRNILGKNGRWGRIAPDKPRAYL